MPAEQFFNKKRDITPSMRSTERHPSPNRQGLIIVTTLATAYMASHFFRAANVTIGLDLMRDLAIGPEEMAGDIGRGQCRDDDQAPAVGKRAPHRGAHRLGSVPLVVAWQAFPGVEPMRPWLPVQGCDRPLCCSARFRLRRADLM